MAAYSDLLRGSAVAERTSVTVNLGGGTMTLYAYPLTGMELDKIALRHPNFATAPTVKAMVDIIVMKALTESDELAFDLGDKPPLMMKPVNLLNQIYVGLFPPKNQDLSDDAIEEAEKN
jgi:hypothetical protein